VAQVGSGSPSKGKRPDNTDLTALVHSGAKVGGLHRRQCKASWSSVKRPGRLRWRKKRRRRRQPIAVKSAYDMDETLVRIKRRAFFDEIDQAQLAASAGIKLPPSQFSAVQDGCGADWAG
jgi:hypothetical protein